MLWSIRYQDRIAHHFRFAVGLGMTIVAFMGVVGAVSPEGALRTLFYGGLILSCLVLFLIVQRRSWLLRIKDPELKEQAYRTMLTYLAARGSIPQQARPEMKKADKEEECTACRV
jgi:predicted lysophospholipase L1 biosynthesis ABC-type transport system permease subunit